MTLDTYIEKLGTLEGLLELLRTCEEDQVIGFASDIAELDELSLRDTDVECLGAGKSRVKYAAAVRAIMNTASYWDQILDRISDQDSLSILHGMIQYFLLPDPSFLLFNEEEDHHCPMKEYVIDGIDEIKEHAALIHEARYGIRFILPVADAIYELAKTLVLLSALNGDLMFTIKMYDIDDLTVEAETFRVYDRPKEEKPMTAVCIAKVPSEWLNVQLMKDNGLVPFLLHKQFGYDSRLVGVNHGDYPYLDTYVRGLKMEFVPTGRDEEKYAYMTEHAGEIDLLIVNGLYAVNYKLVEIFRALNPKGFIYIGLDANSTWMDRCSMGYQPLRDMMYAADVIGTSCHAMQQHLIEKWKLPVECFMNGWYHPWIAVNGFDYAAKENTILTVGRLGTSQKATDILLEAFALIAHRFPTWKLKLVGNVDPLFDGYLKMFRKQHKDIADRIIFTGSISDKIALFDEYQKAKIFALPSRLEGGAPNVIGEALHCGCAAAVAAFDAWEDVIDQGRCGMASLINDIDGFANALATMCSDEIKLQSMCEHAFRYAHSMFSMEKIVSRLHESILEVHHE